VIGILLLLRRYQVPAGSQREEGSTAASTTAVQICGWRTMETEGVQFKILQGG